MNTPTTQREFVIPLENKPGTLADVASALGKSNVNVLGYLLEAQGDFGVFRFFTSDPVKAETWLKESRRPYRSNEIIVAPVPNTPGELGRIATALSKSGVNITASYPSTVNGGVGIAFAVDNVSAAKKIISG